MQTTSGCEDQSWQGFLKVGIFMYWSRDLGKRKVPLSFCILTLSFKLYLCNYEADPLKWLCFWPDFSYRRVDSASSCPLFVLIHSFEKLEDPSQNSQWDDQVTILKHRQHYGSKRYVHGTGWTRDTMEHYKSHGSNQLDNHNNLWAVWTREREKNLYGLGPFFKPVVRWFSFSQSFYSIFQFSPCSIFFIAFQILSNLLKWR